MNRRGLSDEVLLNLVKMMAVAIVGYIILKGIISWFM